MTKRRVQSTSDFQNTSDTTLQGDTVLEMVNRHENLRRQLRKHLMDISFVAFERLMLDLLIRSGYREVQLADRFYKRGRNRQGGLDLKAYSETDIASALTIIQVKQYKRAVPRRFVDELRGTMLRVGAKQGLLITTSTFSRVAQRAAAAIPLLPITLIDGDALLDLLIERQIGVKQELVQRLILNEEFFADFQ